jgi:Domain of unknown function (DUF1906)
MNAVILEPGLRGCDTIVKLSYMDALKLFDAGFRFVGRYVTSLTAAELSDILRAELAVTFISYANSFDPSDEIAALKALQIPKGAVVWLDVEDVKDDPVTLSQRINTWAKAIQAAGYVAGLYVGAGVPLTSAELYALAVTRYWHSCSRVVDSHNNAAEPICGWAMTQCSCEQQRAGVEVDIDFAYLDYKGRGVTMVTA